MARFLKVGVAVTVAVGPFVDSTNGVSAVTGCSAGVNDIRIKKAGAGWSSTGSGTTIFTNDDAGGYFYRALLTAADVDTLGSLVWTFYALNSAMPVWHEFHVISSAAYDGMFTTNTGYPLVDVMMIDHISAANVLISANVGQWRGSVPLALVTGGIPADVMYWAHSSVAAITTAGTVPVDAMYVNHTASAGNAGLLSVNVVQWVSAVVTAPTTAGSIPVDLIYINHSSAQGTLKADVMMWDHTSAASVLVSANVGSIATNVLVSANIGQWRGSVPLSLVTGGVPADVMYWAHSSVAAITTAGTIPVDKIYQNHTSVGTPGGGGDVNVVTWLGATPNSLNAGNIMADVQMWAHSSVSTMPGAPGAIGSVDVSSWGGKAVGAITTAGAVPVDVKFWVSTSVAAVVTAGWPRVEVASYAAGEAPPTSVSIAAGGITSSSFAANAIDSNALDATAVDEILDDALESTLTVRQALRIMLAACAGKLSGAETTNVLIRDFLDAKNRINATVDVHGNRTSVTLDGT